MPLKSLFNSVLYYDYSHFCQPYTYALGLLIIIIMVTIILMQLKPLYIGIFMKRFLLNTNRGFFVIVCIIMLLISLVTLSSLTNGTSLNNPGTASYITEDGEISPTSLYKHDEKYLQIKYRKHFLEHHYQHLKLHQITTLARVKKYYKIQNDIKNYRHYLNHHLLLKPHPATLFLIIPLSMVYILIISMFIGPLLLVGVLILISWI